MEIRNIGIFAHVDAGKTTLTERMLVHSGVLQQAGSVDNGTAHTDSLPIERRRGISVKASCVSFCWNNVQINLIDTPGHTDFSAEIERSLWALDGAILLMDAVDGVQPQTEVLFQALSQQHIPMLFFVNKTDREGADLLYTLAQISRHLTKNCVYTAYKEEVEAYVCGTDDGLLEDYVEGRPISQERVLAQLRELVCSCKTYPIYSGSALKDAGVLELMDAIVDLLPSPESNGEALSGVGFALMQDRIMGRGLLVRLYGGHLENRLSLEIETGVDFLTGTPKSISRKITQIRDVGGHDLGKLGAGEIGVVYGLGELDIGHVFGDRERLPRTVEPGQLRTPLINVRLLPEKPDGMRALREACKKLSEEDPLLNATYISSLNQLHLHVMGTVQLEILAEELQTRFGLKATFTEPSVIFKETIRKIAYGFVDYTMPKPCWAILKFLIEPAPRGSGVSFSSQVPVKDIMARYQHQVEQALPHALKQGRLGWEVTDVKITLVGGEHHLVHTHPLDFIVATPMAIQDGLANGGSTLLEPILLAHFKLPSDCIGRVISDVNMMEGEVLETASDSNRVALKALLPVRTSMNYPTTLAMITSGRGAMNVKLHSYRECPVTPERIAPRRGIDPLDKAKYILAVRNALDGGIFDE
ncbi:MAG: TetM/TetW/TetO/TetS family tetracycline resistance ribosomal protection protein [Victivallales bacterium]|nr:TetM/TetW/TetO/TetS family tetracycline resistance ribosomal protection protein [Victivallales bacterium]